VLTGETSWHVTLCDERGKIKNPIARIVWEAFSGCELPNQVRHKDGNGKNNDFSNLYAGGQ
jgi:hypothetical protein